MRRADRSARIERRGGGSRHRLLRPQARGKECGMRLATVRRRRIAGDLMRSRRPRGRHRGRPREWVTVSFGVGVGMMGGRVASINLVSLVSAAGDTGMLMGLRVPRDQLQAIDSAALSCPVLSPPRLAAQVMAASRFDPRARTADGGSGLAGLSGAQWRRWAPAPGAMRSDAKANIVALAHAICDLSGRVRAAHVPGDGWRLALAAFHSGQPAVIAARGIPAGAVGYVDTVAAYADWYTRQPQFGGTGVATPTSVHRAPIPVPGAYVRDVAAAGRVCAAVTPARVAAQLMAESAFNPNKPGAAGAEGIAQFLPERWTRYAPSAGASPWDPPPPPPALRAATRHLTPHIALRWR